MNPSSPTLTRSRNGVARAAALIVSLAAAGCAGDGSKADATRGSAAGSSGSAPAVTYAPPPSNASNLDPCALRLHDVAGALFLYYFTYQKLPAQIDDLNDFPGAEEKVPLVCPASNQPYIYTADGILLPEQNARVVIYDPTPAHFGGRRWAISITEPRDDKPMVAKVVLLPESFFLLRPPQPPAP